MSVGQDCDLVTSWPSLSIFLWPLQTPSSSNGPPVSEIFNMLCLLQGKPELSTIPERPLGREVSLASSVAFAIWNDFMILLLTRMSLVRAGTASVSCSTVALTLTGNRHFNEHLLNGWCGGKTWRKRQLWPGKAEPAVKFHLCVTHPCYLDKAVLGTLFICTNVCWLSVIVWEQSCQQNACFRKACIQVILPLSPSQLSLRHQHLLGHHFLPLSS